MRLSHFRLELDGLAAGDVGLTEIEFARVEVRVEKRATVGDAGVGARIFRIDLDRLVEHLPRVLETLSAKLVKVLAAAQIVVVGLHVDRARLFDLLLLAFAEYDA